MLPQIAEIIFVKKALVHAEMELGKECFLRVGPERGAADPAQTILLAANHETMEVKVAPIECDLEQLVQRGDAAVTAHVQTPPNRWVNLEEQNVDLINLGGRGLLEHIMPTPLSAAVVRPPFFPRSLPSLLP